MTEFGSDDIVEEATKIKANLEKIKETIDT